MSQRTLVVDLGGVVLRWDPVALVAQALPELAAAHGGAPALAGLLFQDFAADGDWSQFDRGVIGEPELAARMSARTGISLTAAHALLDAVPGHLAFLEPTGLLLDRLHGNGLRLVYLSNMPLRYAAWLETQDRFRGWFVDGVFSARVGHVKPEPEIFDLAQQRLGLDPAATLLIDDRAVNLGQAARHGWSTLLFTGAPQATARLAEMGWL
ncbi:MAG TPA: HAD family phosphatase [Kineosporiaceae bacterium]|nr:HAD family phosphatase [Kineosporiaceae bacterium]